jgi:TetR/AcrR family transcriptional regulator
MYDKFLQLEQEKQDRIINAALNVFAKTNFKNASTDDIVQAAGISKGALFYYFKNKESLYRFLYQYVLNYLAEHLIHQIDTEDRDFLNRILQITLIKINLMKRYTNMFDFFRQSMKEVEQLVSDELKTHYHEVTTESYQKLTNNLDYSLFREDLDPIMIIKTIYWSIDGFGNELINKLGEDLITQNIIDLWETEFKVYLDTLRTCFYKREE